MPDLDFEAQLTAINFALQEHDSSRDAYHKEVAELEEAMRKTRGLRHEFVESEWVGRLHQSVYDDAARSMAAVGMLAPLLESIFFRSFQGIANERAKLKSEHFTHARWEQARRDVWDCHLVWDKGGYRRSLIDGIMQLSEATELDAYLPTDLHPTLSALFEYRNRMFHLGFEWPLDDRLKFAKRIVDANWPKSWFSNASSGGQPWVFYMSSGFIQHVVRTTNDVIEGIGAYCKAEFFPKEC